MTPSHLSGQDPLTLDYAIDQSFMKSSIFLLQMRFGDVPS